MASEFRNLLASTKIYWHLASGQRTFSALIPMTKISLLLWSFCVRNSSLKIDVCKKLQGQLVIATCVSVPQTHIGVCFFLFPIKLHIFRVPFFLVCFKIYLAHEQEMEFAFRYSKLQVRPGWSLLSLWQTPFETRLEFAFCCSKCHVKLAWSLLFIVLYLTSKAKTGGRGSLQK